MYSHFFLSLVFGSVLGIIYSLFNFHPSSRLLHRHYKECVDTSLQNEAPWRSTTANNSYANTFLYIGVMTASKYLDTRAWAVNQTWASDIPGHVEFYTGFNDTKSFEAKCKQMPIRVLHGVKDSEYPPQKKVFAMLRYMYENYLDTYEWFMRADDDVYIRTDKLMEFLRTLDSSADMVVGQGGTGKQEELNKLGLMENECYCLGGPGVIMSRGVLKKITPNLESCLNETASDHEDVELGRCIRKYAGVSCLWAHQTKELFQQVYKDQETAYHGVLDKVKINKALTLHPVKDPAYMFRLHHYFLSRKLFRLHYHAYKTNGILSITKRIIPGQIVPRSFAKSSRNIDFYLQANISSQLEWEYLIESKHSMSIRILNLKNTNSNLQLVKGNGMRDAIAQTMQELNVQYKKKRSSKKSKESDLKTKSKITLKGINYGYLRINPKYGVQYQFSLSIKLPFDPARFPWFHQIPTAMSHWAQVNQGFASIQGRTRDVKRGTMNIVVPLREKYNELKSFSASLKEAFLLETEQIAVVIVYFPDSSSPKRHIQLINKLKLEFPETKFVWLEMPGEFNRAKALQKGAEYLGDDALMFFSDIDLFFQKEFIYRCRDNTIKGQQVYMPFMFGQYNPAVAYFDKSRPDTNFVYTKEAGRWRIHSYGPVCIYGGDVMAVGGLNTNIKGWGKEDTDFANRVIKHGLSIFRAPDKAIVHVYHKHVPCDESLAGDQRYECEMATRATYAPKKEAVDYLFAKRHIE